MEAHKDGVLRGGAAKSLEIHFNLRLERFEKGHTVRSVIIFYLGKQDKDCMMKTQCPKIPKVPNQHEGLLAFLQNLHIMILVMITGHIIGHYKYYPAFRQIKDKICPDKHSPTQFLTLTLITSNYLIPMEGSTLQR